MKPPTTPSRDIFGAEFNGTPSHQRVLKPPGGGTSDIFGANGEPDMNVRRVKNHLASNVFLSDGPSTTPSTPSKSPVTNGDAHDGAETPATPNGNTSPVLNGNRHVNGNSGSGSPSPGNGGGAQQRQRVPPGGFSSTLW